MNLKVGFSKADQLHKKEKAVIPARGEPVEPARAKPVKKRKPLKLMSKRAKAELKVWHEIRTERMKLLIAKYGHVMCEFCGKRSVDNSPDPHHNDWDRRNNELDNCRILHRICHTKVHDENIREVPSLL